MRNKIFFYQRSMSVTYIIFIILLLVKLKMNIKCNSVGILFYYFFILFLYYFLYLFSTLIPREIHDVLWLAINCYVATILSLIPAILPRVNCMSWNMLLTKFDYCSCSYTFSIKQFWNMLP